MWSPATELVALCQKNMCLRKDLTEEIIANHFMMTHVFIMQPSTESFSFAVFLRYANALHSRDEPQCRVGLGKKNEAIL